MLPQKNLTANWVADTRCYIGNQTV